MALQLKKYEPLPNLTVQGNNYQAGNISVPRPGAPARTPAISVGGNTNYYRSPTGPSWNTPRPVPGLGTQARDLGVGIARSIPRGIFELGLTLGENFNHQTTYNPSTLGRPGELIFGKEPIVTSTQAAKDFTKSLPGHKNLPTALAVPIGLALSSPIGPGKKAVGKIMPKVAKNDGIEKAVQQVMNEDGIGREAAAVKVDKMLRDSVKPDQQLYEAGTDIKPKATAKSPEAQAVLKKLSSSKTSALTEADLTANILKSAAKREGVKLDQNFINRYQAGTLANDAERRVAQTVKAETDRVFKQQQALNPNTEYRKNYVPQSYSQDAPIVEQATHELQLNTKSGAKRQFNTYQEADQYGLTPRYKTLDQMIGANASEATRALGNREAVQQGLSNGLFTANPEKAKGLTPVEGFVDSYGNQIYATKKVADTITGVMQDSTTGVSRFLKKSKEFNGAWQDIALSGGIPATPLNFFTFGQVIKDLTAGRVSVAKDLIYSMSKRATAKRFASNSEFVRAMSKRGVPFNVQSSLTNAERNPLNSIWGQAINQPTFERFMPNQYLSLAENTAKRLQKKGLSQKEAYDIAAETTKKFYGIIDDVARGRSRDAHNAIGSIFFAARYRESILHTLYNTAKSVTPGNLRDPSYAMNRRLLAGMALTAYGYNELNKQINGHGMLQNRKGQETSLQIPYGKPGDRTVINVPFMPSFLTVPRAVFNALNSARQGDVKGVTSEAGKVFSQPINTASAIISNKNYFGEPIYVSPEVANAEGVKADSNGQAAKKVGTYLAGQASPGWVRAGIAQAQGKPIEKVAATALEAPVRFGKVPDPKLEAYHNAKDEARNQLNVNERAVFDKLYPKGKNIRGEDIKDTNPNTRIEKSTLLRANKNVFDKVSQFQRKLGKNGEAIDPVYTLDWGKARNVLWARSLPPGESSDTKDELLYKKSWYKDFAAKEDKYYSALEKKFGKRDDPYKYPERTNALNTKLDNYYKLPKGTGERSDFIDAHPELVSYWDKQHEATNRHRKALGLPALPKRPTFAKSSSGSSGGSSSGSTSGSKRVSSKRYRATRRSGGTARKKVLNPYQYAVSLHAGGSIARPKVSVRAPAIAKGKSKAKSSKPNVSIKKSKV